MLDNKFMQQVCVVDKFVDPNADYQMTSRDVVVHASADTISGPITITLPKVSEVKGRIYSIISRTASDTNTITISSDSSAGWSGDYVLTSVNDYMVFYSDGSKWAIIAGTLSDHKITLTGDVTGSGTETIVCTIPDNTITYAKMQSVSSTDKLLGRSSAGVGVVEEIPCTAAGRAILDDIDNTAQRVTLGLVIGTDIEAYDATLESIAALGTVADRFAYTTAIDTWAETPLTAFARTFLDDADAPSVQTTLGLVIGTDVQAYTAFLDSVAALGTAADKMIYTTGVGVAAETAITTAGRAILDDADNVAQLVTLGLTAIAADINQTSGIGGPALATKTAGDRVEYGRETFANAGTAAADVTVAVTFATAYNTAPVVTIGSETSLVTYISTPASLTGFSLTISQVPAATTVYANWTTIGQ